MFGTLFPVHKGKVFFKSNVFFSLCLYRNEQTAQICISPKWKVSLQDLSSSPGRVYTQESSGGGLLSMRPTAGLPALMKCFLSLVAWVRKYANGQVLLNFPRKH